MSDTEKDCFLYYNLSQVINLMVDEKVNPLFTSIPEFVDIVKPWSAMMRKQIDIVIKFKKYLEQDVNDEDAILITPEEIAKDIVRYGMDIANLGTEIKHGVHVDAARRGYVSLQSELRKVNLNFSHYLTVMGIRPVAGSRWSPNAPQVHFGDIANVSALDFHWSDTEATHITRLYVADYLRKRYG